MEWLGFIVYLNSSLVHIRFDNDVKGFLQQRREESFGPSHSMAKAKAKAISSYRDDLGLVLRGIFALNLPKGR
jgi:hypothetical protein